MFEATPDPDEKIEPDNSDFKAPKMVNNKVRDSEDLIFITSISSFLL